MSQCPNRASHKPKKPCRKCGGEHWEADCNTQPESAHAWWIMQGENQNVYMSAGRRCNLCAGQHFKKDCPIILRTRQPRRANITVIDENEAQSTQNASQTQTYSQSSTQSTTQSQSEYTPPAIPDSMEGASQQQVFNNTTNNRLTKLEKTVDTIKEEVTDIKSTTTRTNELIMQLMARQDQDDSTRVPRATRSQSKRSGSPPNKMLKKSSSVESMEQLL